MSRPYDSLVLLFAVFSLGFQGCITVRSEGMSLDKLSKPKLAKVQTNDDVEEAPPDPKHPEQLKVAYARWMEGAGNADEARKQYEGVLSKEPGNVEAMMGIARIDHAAGNLQEAEKGFRKAVELQPDSAAAHLGLGRFHAAERRWEDALTSYKRVVELTPDDNDSRYQYAVALARSGKVQEALPHFIRTVGDAEAHYNAALILKDQGRLADAERHLVIAVDKKPELEPAKRWLDNLRSQREGSLEQPVVAGEPVRQPRAELARFEDVPENRGDNFRFPAQQAALSERSDRPLP